MLSDYDRMKADPRSAALLEHEERKLAVTERLAEMGFHVPDDEELDRLLDALAAPTEAEWVGAWNLPDDGEPRLLTLADGVMTVGWMDSDGEWLDIATEAPVSTVFASPVVAWRDRPGPPTSELVAFALGALVSAPAPPEQPTSGEEEDRG